MIYEKSFYEKQMLYYYLGTWNGRKVHVRKESCETVYNDPDSRVSFITELRITSMLAYHNIVSVIFFYSITFSLYLNDNFKYH